MDDEDTFWENNGRHSRPSFRVALATANAPHHTLPNTQAGAPGMAGNSATAPANSRYTKLYDSAETSELGLSGSRASSPAAG